MEGVRRAVPYAVGSISGSMIFSCSMIEPGHPWFTTIGDASSRETERGLK